MNTINDLTYSESGWKPQFIEDINQYSCLDCDIFNEVIDRNILRVHSINQNGVNSQNKTIDIANPEQCADCTACTENYTEKLYTHYSFSV